MNSGFDPVVVNPSGFKIQRASQQSPFRFGGSQVPLHLGMSGGMLKRDREVPALPLLTMKKQRLFRILNAMHKQYVERYGDSKKHMKSMDRFYEAASKAITEQDTEDPEVYKAIIDHIHSESLK